MDVLGEKVSSELLFSPNYRVRHPDAHLPGNAKLSTHGKNLSAQMQNLSAQMHAIHIDKWGPHGCMGFVWTLDFF
jgi:hypothetical protein